MIEPSEVREIASQWGIADFIIENDYVLGWLLWGIAQNQRTKLSWVLKGGSAIKKCYVDTHRYSQDLDFTVLPEGVFGIEELNSTFTDICVQINGNSGIDFNIKPPRFIYRPGGESCEGRIYYIGPRGNPTPTAIKLDLTQSEDLIRPPVLRKILHPYSDTLPGSSEIYCYNLEELFAEKIRSLFERSRPTDLYDIIYLFRRSDVNAEPEVINEVLGYKCAWKDIPIPLIGDIHTSERYEEMRKRWKPMMGRRIGYLPPLDDYWNELPTFFAWLIGEEYTTPLIPIDKEKLWTPPKLYWQVGQKELLEPIRHAAVNRILVNLGYKDKYRLVEPYSLRLTRAGNILFYGIKAETREIRAYRIDRIQSIEVTKTPYKPMFAIEFTPEGRIPVPLVRRRIRFLSRQREHKYIIRCAVCGKLFYRDKYSTRIAKHKWKDSTNPCPGRYGFLE